MPSDQPPINSAQTVGSCSPNAKLAFSARRSGNRSTGSPLRSDRKPMKTTHSTRYSGARRSQRLIRKAPPSRTVESLPP